MPLMHCNSCHHEWAGRPNTLCDWCGASGYVLEEKTSFERFCEELPEILKEFCKKDFPRAKGKYLTLIASDWGFYRKWYEKLPLIGDWAFRRRAIQGLERCQQK